MRIHPHRILRKILSRSVLDSDDVWLPEKLEQRVTILQSNPKAAMVYGPAQYWYSWTGNPDDIPRDFVAELGVQPDSLVSPPDLVTAYLRDRAAVPCPCSLLVVREAIELVGGFEESFRDQYEDQVFYAKICLNAPVFVTGHCWDRYRQHSNSCCSVALQIGQNYSARLRFWKWLRRYMRDQEVPDSEVWKALQSQLQSYRHQRWPSLVPRRWRRYLASAYRWFWTQWHKS
jgi:hypothetical protein